MPAINGSTLRAWRRFRSWDVPEMARQLRRVAHGLGTPLATTQASLVQMIYAWERGDHKITERYELLYATALGVDADQLAHGPPASLPVPVSRLSVTIPRQQQAGGHYGTAIPDWPAWFGLKLAQLITLTDAWHLSHLDELQSLLNQEISMSDAAMPRDEGQVSALQALSRRQALMTLGALPLATRTPSAKPGKVLLDDAFLSRCAASLTACWHLLKGSDLTAVEQLLADYLMPLEAAARQESHWRQPAARLAAQAHRICGILSLHRDQLRVREQHCKRALGLAVIAADAGSHASALISLASTYFYASDPAAAAAVYEQAFSHGAALPPLQRSRVYAELAVVYGQLGREQDSIRAAGQAEELYPERPEEDPSFLYAEFTPASLVLERGLAYVALAERFPGRGHQGKAAAIFGQTTQPAPQMPDRIRFEIVNHQASTAVLLGDLDAFETYWDQGLTGTALLGAGSG